MSIRRVERSRSAACAIWPSAWRRSPTDPDPGRRRRLSPGVPAVPDRWSAFTPAPRGGQGHAVVSTSCSGASYRSPSRSPCAAWARGGCLRDQVQVCGSTKTRPNLVFADPGSARAAGGDDALDTGAGVTKLVAQSALLAALARFGGETTGLAGNRSGIGSPEACDDVHLNTRHRRCARLRPSPWALGRRTTRLDATGAGRVLSEKDVAIACGKPTCQPRVTYRTGSRPSPTPSRPLTPEKAGARH